MDESGFRAWLLGEGRESSVKESGASHRVERLRKLEGKLAELGVSFTSLDLAYNTDRLASVIAAVAELQADFKAGGEKYRVLMPQSEAPKNRLSNMKRFVGQYRDYLDGSSTGETDADRIRRHALDTYIVPCSGRWPGARVDRDQNGQ